MAADPIDKMEINVKYGENACDQYFLLFPQYFQKAFFTGFLKPEIVW